MFPTSLCANAFLDASFLASDTQKFDEEGRGKPFDIFQSTILQFEKTIYGKRKI